MCLLSCVFFVKSHEEREEKISWSTESPPSLSFCSVKAASQSLQRRRGTRAYERRARKERMSACMTMRTAVWAMESQKVESSKPYSYSRGMKKNRSPHTERSRRGGRRKKERQMKNSPETEGERSRKTKTERKREP